MSARQQPQVPDTEFEVAPTEIETPTPPIAPRIALRTLPSSLRDRYRIESELSSGGSEADIFRVRSIASNDQRAVKLYRGNKQPKARVLQAVASSPSEHLLAILEFGESDGYWYELTEFIEFGSLRELLSHGAISHERCLALLDQLAQALCDLHALRIFHRDVKPDNVLIKQKDPFHIVLSDYGIASETDGTTWETAWAGTAIYMAPEVIGGKTHLVSSACDYWALGMMLTEALTGTHPFKNLGTAVAFHHLATKSIDLSNVPIEWRRLCRGLLLRDPAERWGHQQVKRWLSGERNTIPLGEDTTTTPVVGAYVFNGKSFAVLSDLLGEFAKPALWSKGTAELRQGHLTDWLRKNSQYEAASYVEELRNDMSLTEDVRLFLAVARFCPSLPLVWRGQVLNTKSLLSLAVKQDESALGLLTDIFDQQLILHPRLENRESIQLVGRNWAKAARENQSLWDIEPLQSMAALHRGDRRIELCNALLAGNDTGTCANLLKHLQGIIQQSSARRCVWFTQQVSQASSEHGKLHALALLVDQAIQNGDVIIAEEAKQAKASEDASLWRQRRRKLVAQASFFGLGIGSTMGAIRYWMVSSSSLLSQTWDFKGSISKWDKWDLAWQALGVTGAHLLAFAVAIFATLGVVGFYSWLCNRYFR